LPFTCPLPFIKQLTNRPLNYPTINPIILSDTRERYQMAGRNGPLPRSTMKQAVRCSGNSVAFVFERYRFEHLFYTRLRLSWRMLNSTFKLAANACFQIFTYSTPIVIFTTSFDSMSVVECSH